MAKAGNYYYDQLNKEQQRAYYAIKEGLLKLQDSFPVPMLSGKELADIYFMIRMDCPEIFYVPSFRYRYYPDSANVEFMPERDSCRFIQIKKREKRFNLDYETAFNEKKQIEERKEREKKDIVYDTNSKNS